MDPREFLRLLRLFADRPEDVIFDKSQFTVEIQSTTLAGTMTQTLDGFVVNDGNGNQPLQRWIVETLAQLPILARRIQEQLPNDPLFVEPAATLEANYSSTSDTITCSLPAADFAARKWCDDQYAFASRVLYITSDAGEGKTTLISRLAAIQAARFLERKSPWLLLPVALGGRPFLRLDEVIIASLSQQFRFQRLYFDAFIELVRMGVIVLALDGFEEMFVEGKAGDAVSALGNLVSLLQSRGTVVIAARKAYFDYKSFDTQAKLFDSLQTVDVEFARLHLQRWDKARFCAYASKAGVDDPDALYSFWNAKVHGDPDHPILCRPVLIKHVVRLGTAEAEEERVDGGNGNGASPMAYYEPFVREILKREAAKWISRSSAADTPAGPLISVDDHFRLLASVAREMWMSEDESLGGDGLDFASEDFCGSAKLNPSLSRQVVERVKQHALLVSTADKKRFRFDHEEFFRFFLGWAIADECCKFDEVQLIRLLRDRPVPIMAIEAAAGRVRLRGDVPIVVELLSAACESEQMYSALRENCGNLAVLSCLDGIRDGRASVRLAAITQNVLSKGVLRDVSFDSCFFGPIELKGVELQGCTFVKCHFQQMIVSSDVHCSETSMEDCEFESILIDAGDDGGQTAIYSPNEISAVMASIGVTIVPSPADSEECDAGVEEASDEIELRLLQRFLRIFARATGVNEGVVRQRLGTSSREFFDEMLPRLKEAGVVVDVDYRGGGSQRRFKLALPMSVIQSALERCRGQFGGFLELVRS